MTAIHPSYWGREEVKEDAASPGPYGRLALILDHELWPWTPGEAPLLGHWLNFLPDAAQSRLGHDGHPRRGSFLPPVDLPRRMWAGSRLEFLAPIAIGASLLRRTRIVSIEEKAGRSGPMAFVRLDHEIWADGVLARREAQDIVYRDHPPANARPPQARLGVAAEGAELSEGRSDLRRVAAEPALLFRYSALTFNAHRIHYDEPYARGSEGYPGLVVQGPLTATLLLDAFQRRRPSARIRAFEFRAERPLFSPGKIDLAISSERDDGVDLEARGEDGERALSASVQIAPERAAAGGG